MDRYGPIFKVWFDGFKGKKCNPHELHVYWVVWNGASAVDLCANIFSNIGLDVRWVRDEFGDVVHWRQS